MDTNDFSVHYKTRLKLVEEEFAEVERSMEEDKLKHKFKIKAIVDELEVYNMHLQETTNLIDRLEICMNTNEDSIGVKNLKATKFIR